MRSFATTALASLYFFDAAEAYGFGRCTIGNYFDMFGIEGRVYMR